MRFLLSVLLISFLVFFFSCKTKTEDEPTVPSSPAKPLEEPKEGVDEEKPLSIVVPVASLGDVSETRKKILQNILEDELKSHFKLISQERFEEAQEKAFEELDYEECTEDQCIMMIQEMLQVENVFHLEVIGEGKDTQLSLSWRTLDENKKETDICGGCGTIELSGIVMGLVGRLVGVEEEMVVKEKLHKKIEPVVGKVPKVVSKFVKKTEEKKTEGMFVAVGTLGTLLTSSDGISWTERTSGTSDNLFGVTYGNGLFVTVGMNGIVLTSNDGISWTERTSETSDNLFGVTYGNGLFVKVGNRGSIYISSDGISWTKRTSGTSISLEKIIYENGLFVTVGRGGTILTSSNGHSWMSQRTSKGWHLISGVTYENGFYVTVGGEGTILTSSNGTSWIKRNSGISNTLLGVTYGNGKFVSVGSEGIILSSNDGTFWTKRNSWTSKTLYGVIFSQ